MTKDELKKIYKQMLWIIPGMLLAMVGDYCMGVEPKDSHAISLLISTGWLTIADWRIAVSNIGGLIGTVCYTLAALPFARFLRAYLPACRSKADRRLVKLYIAGLILGVMSFLYFHIACGTLIHTYTVLLCRVRRRRSPRGGDVAAQLSGADRPLLGDLHRF